MSIRGAEVALRWISPRILVEHESSSRVEAAAVDVQWLVGMGLAVLVHPGIVKQRHAGHAFDQSALEDQRIQGGGGRGNSKRESAGVAHDGADLPIARDPRERLTCETRCSCQQCRRPVSPGNNQRVRLIQTG